MVCGEDEECAFTDAVDLVVAGDDDNGFQRVDLDVVNHSPFDTWEVTVVD